MDKDYNVYDLMDHRHFFSDPEGLGFSKNINQLSINNEYIVYGDSINQDQITGKIIFHGYNYYSDFIKFIRHSPLTLVYIIEEEKFKIDIEVPTITKTEKTSNGWLECSVSFLKTSLWYKNTTINIVEEDERGTKKFNYSYPYKYSNSSTSRIVLNNDGDIATPLTIEVLGKAINPSYFLKQNDILVGNGKVWTEIDTGNKLVVNSSFLQPEISEYTNSNTYLRNLYTEADLSTTRFIRVPIGESIFTFLSDDLKNPQIKLSYKVYYATV